LAYEQAREKIMDRRRHRAFLLHRTGLVLLKMSTDELFIEGVALGVRQMLGDERFFSIVAQMAADAIAKRFELLDPTEAANLLRVTAKTLTDNHREWGLDKSVAFGAKNPRYFLSQILERAAEKTVNGRRTDLRTLQRLDATMEGCFVNSDGKRISAMGERMSA
jgi:hypothetical protein